MSNPERQPSRDRYEPPRVTRVYVDPIRDLLQSCSSLKGPADVGTISTCTTLSNKS